MVEESESVTERIEETIHEMAEHAKADWLRWSALFSAIFAVLASISSLESGHAANEAMLRQIDASDEWNIYQAKGIKAMISELQTTGEAKAKVEKYRHEQDLIKETADEFTQESAKLLTRHEILSRAMALFQVAIAITAIALMTRRKGFLLFSIALGVLGTVFLVQGLLA